MHPGLDLRGVGPDDLRRLERRLARERAARSEAEEISERTTRELYDKQQELALIASVTAAANEASDLEAALQVAVDEVCGYARWPVGHAYVPDDAGVLRPTEVWHTPRQGAFERFVEITRATSLEPGEGLPGRVLASREPMWIPDVLADPNFPRARQADDIGVRAAMAFPVLVGDEVVSVLEFFADRPLEADTPLLEAVSQIGTQLGRVVERTRAREALTRQALEDALTGLPNRVLFLDRLRQALARSDRAPGSVGVLFLDLDRFKVLNDSLGHGIGDRLLVALARRLEEVIRPGDTVARFGGDKFTILCENLDSAHHATGIAERVLEAIALPIELDDDQAFVTAGIGIALESEATEPEALIRDADAAVHTAKESGAGQWELFDATLRSRVTQRHETENALHHAIGRGEFVLHYQPEIGLSSGRTCGVEALVRWNHPERGMVSPLDFIPLAEETGVIVALGAWVLEEACRQGGRWRAERPDSGLLVGVNLSARQLEQPGLRDLVEGVLADTGLAPDALCLEVTESVLLRETQKGLAALESLKELGVKIAIDDFGTGYSSLTALKHFPADVLKIDRSFVAGLGSDRADSAIVSAVIDLAHDLGLTTIGEGVETPVQLAALQALGCDMAQGYHFARPAPATSLDDLLAGS